MSLAESLAKATGGKINEDGSISANINIEGEDPKGIIPVEQLKEENKEKIQSVADEPKGEPANKDNANSSLNNEKQKSEVKNPEPVVKKEPPPVVEVKTPEKTFEQSFKERFGMEFTDAEKKLKENPYASETVAKINEFVKNGGAFDNNWLRVQTTDYASISDPVDLLKEQFVIQNPGMTEEEVKFELNQKYRFSEWSEEGEEPTEEQAELERVMVAKINRDAENARKTLVENQKKQLLVDKPREEDLAQKKAELDKNYEMWDNNVKITVESLKSIALKISDTETLDIPVAESKRNDVAKLMSDAGRDVNAFWEKFVVDKKLDMNKLSKSLYVAENWEDIIKKIVSDERANGGEKVIKDLKNTNFEPTPQAVSVEKKVAGRQIAESLQLSKML